MSLKGNAIIPKNKKDDFSRLFYSAVSYNLAYTFLVRSKIIGRHDL
jgi:hypothetical protein